MSYTPPRRGPDSARTVARGFAATMALLALVLGVPLALLFVAGSPVPRSLPTWVAAKDALLRPDDGSLFVAALRGAAWLGWASFAVSAVLDVVARIRSRSTPHVLGLGSVQRMTAPLVATAALLFSAPLAMMPVASALSTTSSSAVSVPEHPDARSVAPMTSASLSHRAFATSVADETPVSGVHRPGGRTHLVRDGETLWRIAEQHLGTGKRYREIAVLNYGVEQADGESLDSGHWLQPGWVLLLPSDSTDAESDELVVRPGDTLWDLAEKHLGAGDRYVDIVRASADIRQPDGGRLSDAQDIRPGWRLRLPSAVGADRPPRADLPSAEPGSGATTDGPRLDRPAASTEPAPSGGAAQQQDWLEEAASGHESAQTGCPSCDRPAEVADPTATGDFAEESDTVVLQTASGAGALLAAGVIGVLGVKRSRQQRRRRAGRRIPMPVGVAETTEFDWRVSADVNAVRDIDLALRALASSRHEAGLALPSLRLLRLTPRHLELQLGEAAELPEPFVGTANRTVWSMDRDIGTRQSLAQGRGSLVEEVAPGPAPYPALVSLGHDVEGAHLLVDLEYLGALHVTGQSSETTAVLTGLAVEIATSSWADDVQVTLVGLGSELGDALGNGRIRHVAAIGHLLPEWEERAATVRRLLAEAGCPDLGTARARHVALDALTPEIVIVMRRDDEDMGRLNSVLHTLPRVGIAVITGVGEPLGEWVLRLPSSATGSAVLRPGNLAVHPQRLGQLEYARVIGLLRLAESAAQLTVSPPAAHVPIVGTEPVDPGTPLGLGHPDGVIHRQGRNSPDSVAALDTAGESIDGQVADSEAVPRASASEAGSGATTETGEALYPDTAPYPDNVPVIRVLGPVDLLNVTGPVESVRRRKLLELATYLALHPTPEYAAVDAHIWPRRRVSPDTRWKYVSLLRRWFGTAPDGTEYVPRVGDGEGYRLHPAVTTDWQLWGELLREGVELAGEDDLTAALRLVRGQPFGATPSTRYAWAERDQQDMISAIVDAAHELAGRALQRGDVATARWASVTGRLADPASELLWRDWLKSEHQAGNTQGVNEIIGQLTAWADDFGGDLDLETEALLEEILTVRPRGAHAR